ncbi:Replication factor A protein 1 [Coemansia aciculifera]|uniref:Replication factor A protein 1 n=1 Tax=Coemansia aciculifera TaxID=417176 RepID=A0A9W8IGF4_9FUNG|nr:Replication factor A protein 1 [Coemansia aciculifera]
MSIIGLSAGELQRRFQVKNDVVIITPLVLQIVSPVTLLKNQTESTWPVRVCMVSDGKSIVWAKIALLDDETITQFNIIKINSGVTRKKAGAKDVPLLTIVILDLEILGTWYERVEKPVMVANQDEIVSALPPSPGNKIDLVWKALSAYSAVSAENAVGVESVENAGNAKLPFKTVAQISQERIGTTLNYEYFLLKCTVVGICVDRIVYAVCPDDRCRSIVTEDDASAMWYCKGCKGMWSNPLYLYDFSFDVNDDTGHIQLQCLHYAGKLLLGATAVELFKLQRDDKEAFAWKVPAPKGKKYVFKCKA